MGPSVVRQTAPDLSTWESRTSWTLSPRASFTKSSIYDQALLLAGLPVEDMGEYTRLVCELMV